MASPFVGEIRAVGFNFAPVGWALCDGQLISISQNTALFSLINTYYGGNGKSNFALPNLQGCLSVNQGQGPGLSPYDIGQSGGAPAVTLIQSEMPLHTHSLLADGADPPDGSSPNNAALGTGPNTKIYADKTSPQVQMSPSAISPAGGSLPHNNMMPFLCLTFIIAMQGIFPSRG